jgi:tellurite resistance protein
MGLFDDDFDALKAKGLSKQEAFAGVLLGATASDGHISDDEMRGLCTVLFRMKMFENWTDDRINQVFNRLLGMIKREGVEKVLQKCAQALPEELHKTAFANACDMILADGVVEEEEKEFISLLWKALGISGDDAKTIAQVMVIKNKG